MSEDFRQAEQNTVVGEDSRALQLTHYVLAERLTAVDIADFRNDIADSDYTVIAEIIGNGFRGFHNMSSGELWAEWQEREERFYRMYEDGELPYELNEEDPLVALEQDENGEVAKG